jgi:hypothetical protein
MKTYFYTYLENKNGAQYNSGTLSVGDAVPSEEIYQRTTEAIQERFNPEKFCIIALNQL